MAHYDLEEQEQIDTLKTWWKMYGNLVTSLLAVVALAAAGWQGWNWYRNDQAGKAAAVFAALEQAQEAGDVQRVKATAGELTEKYASSGYAGLGAMIAARSSMDSGDLKTARAQLGWVVEHASDELRDIARLRLSAVLLDDKAYEEALKQLADAPSSAFAARFLEMKGDVLSAQGKTAEARAAYQEAIGKAGSEVEGAGRELLQQKLDSLGETA